VLYQINGIRIVLFFLICYTKHMKNTKHGVSPHFSIEALKQRYLACECPRERMRWHAIWLLADTEHPRTPREVADIIGCTVDCVRKLRRRYNADGEEALRDKRKTNGGRPFLDASQQASLEKALSAPPIDGGLWTGPKVAAWISGTLQRPVSAVTGWKYLRRLGWTLQRPRPQHQASATPEAQQTFKKN
jgi:transposase